MLDIFVASVKKQDNLICLVLQVCVTKPHTKNYNKISLMYFESKGTKNTYLANKQVIKLESIIEISDSQMNLSN